MFLDEERRAGLDALAYKTEDFGEKDPLLRVLSVQVFLSYLLNEGEISGKMIA
jgi:hypothetical protein